MRTRTAWPAGETHSTSRRSTPARRSSTRSCATQLAVADVERLVVDEQADELAVGDVDDRLARLRVAVAGLRVGQRPQLVEGVQVGAGQAVRLALVEVAAQPDVAVGEREDRLGLGEHVERSRLVSRSGPRLDRESWRARSSACEQLGEIAYDDVGAVLAQRVGLPDAVDADDAAEAAGAPGLDAGERVLEDGRGVGRDAEGLGGGEERVRRRLALQVLALRDDRRRSAPRTGPRCRRPPGRRGSWCSTRRPRGAARRRAPPPGTGAEPG